MKSYILDANVYLRFRLKDNALQAKKATAFLRQARERKISLILYPEIVLEIAFVLESVYKLAKEDIVQSLSSICKTDYISVVDRSILLRTIDVFDKKNIDLTDCLLYARAEETGAEILSFDKDFNKLKDISNKASINTGL